MEIKNNKVYFSSGSDWKNLNLFLAKNKKRVILGKPWTIEFREENPKLACLVQEIEDMSSNLHLN